MKSRVPEYTNGTTIDDPSTVPDLDPTLVKSVAMQETVMGTYDGDKGDRNDATKDVMQSNVYYSEKSNDWSDSKTQFGLEKGKGVSSAQQSIRAGIGILYQKGLKGSSGAAWTGGADWGEAVRRYNGGGVANYKENVFKMKDGSKKPTSTNY